MEQSSLSYKTFKNVSYSFIGFVVPIVFSVFITPVIVHKLGVAEYGVLILTNTIMGFLGLLDLGLTAGVVKKICEYYALHKLEVLQKMLSTANSTFWIIGLINFLIFFISGKFFLKSFNIVANENLFLVFILVGFTSFLTAINSVHTSIPQALQRFDIVNKINLTQLLIYNLGALGLALLGFQLKAILALNLITVIGLSLAYRFYSRKILPEIKLKFLWDFLELKQLYGFGIFTAIANIGMSAVNQFDRLLIPIFLGPTQLTYYSLPGNVAQKTTTVVGSLGGTFFPLANELSAKGEVERLGVIFRKVIRNLAVLASATTVSIILFGNKILLYWLGEDFALAGTKILYILAITYFLLSLFGIAFNFLMGLNQQKVVAKWSLLMAGVNFLLLLVLLKPFGILGAAWAYLGSALPIIGLFYWMEKKVFFFQDIAKFYGKLFLKLFVTAVLFVVIVGFTLWEWTNSFTSLVLFGPIAVLLYLIIYWSLGFMEAEDEQLFRGFGIKILERFKLSNTSSNEDIRN